MKFDIGDLYEHLSRKSKFSKNRTEISVTLHEGVSRFCNADSCDVEARTQYKGTDCYISMTAPARCTLLTATRVAYYYGNSLLPFCGSSGYPHGARYCVIRRLPIVF